MEWVFQVYRPILWTAFLGGFIIGAFGLIYILASRITRYHATADVKSTQLFRDGVLATLIALAAQSFILGIPWIYGVPDRLPSAIAEPALVGFAIMVTCWCWAWVSFFRAGRGGMQGTKWKSKVILLLPAASSATVLVGLSIHRFH